MKLYTYFLLVIPLFFCYSAYAQNQDQRIKGYIIDSKTNAGIEFANIALYKSKDSSFLSGSASGKNGEFIIPKVPTGKYYMRINFVGYKTKTIPNISISNSQKEVTLGKMAMEESAIIMSETEVTGKRQTIEYRLDKKIFNISQDISAIGGTALDAMKNQPSVQTNAEGNIVIRGSESFTVLIDGRPSLLQGSDALKTIPANMIESIELITNPSARYDAEGVSGIVNIITKKNTESTLSYVANAGGGTNERYNGDFNISYRNHDYSINAGADYRKEKPYGNQDYTKTSFDTTGEMKHTGVLHDDRPREVYNFRFGADYNLDNNTNIFFSAVYGYNKNKNLLFFKNHLYSSALNQYAITKDDNTNTNRSFSTSVSLSHKFIPKVNALNVELFYGYLKSPNSEELSEFNSNDGFSIYNELLSGKEYNEENGIKRIRFKTNYTHNIDSSGKFETGLQADLLNKDRNLQLTTYNFEDDLWGLMRGETNNIEFKNYVYSAYGLYSGKLFNIDYQIGIRAELTDRIFELKTINIRYEYDKLHVFPSFHLSKSYGVHTFQASYSARIQRPSEWMLHPYVITSDSYIVFYGNPNLKAETIDSYELNYQTTLNRINFSIGSYLRNSSNKVFQNFTIDDKQRISYYFDNFNKVVESGAEISANFPVFDILKLSPSLNLYNTNNDGMISGDQITGNHFSWNSKMLMGITLSKMTQLQFSIQYDAKSTELNLSREQYWNYSGSIRHTLFENKVNLSLQARNLFNATKTKIHLKENTWKLDHRYIPEPNIFTLTVSYNFNDFKRPNKRVNESIND